LLWALRRNPRSRLTSDLSIHRQRINAGTSAVDGDAVEFRFDV
jgi:hypothetical protein